MMDITIKSDQELFDEQKFKEIEALFIADGWSKCTRDIDNQRVLVLNDCGLDSIKLRYLQWDGEYSEWHQRTFWSPGFFYNEDYSVYEMDDMIDNSKLLMIATSLPRITENSKKAQELLEEYWDTLM